MSSAERLEPTGATSIGGFENIDLYNGRLAANFPLVTLGGRGEVSFTPTLRIRGADWNVSSSMEHYHEDCPEEPCQDFYRWYHEVRDWSEYSDNPGYGPGVMNVHVNVGNSLEPFEQNEPIQYCNEGYYSNEKVKLVFTESSGASIEFVDLQSGGAIDYHTRGPSPINRGRTWISSDGSGAVFIADTDYEMLQDSCASRVYGATGHMHSGNGVTYRIEGGNVTWMADRNGNRITFGTVNGVWTATDSLNRQITINYADEGEPYGYCLVIAYKGFGEDLHKIRIKPGVAPGPTPFPELVNNPYQLPQQPAIQGGVVTNLWLSDGREYTFQYNNYQELTQVTLPTGAAYRYSYAPGSPNGPLSSPNGIVGPYQTVWTTNPNETQDLDIYRRLTERRVYKNIATEELESKTIYEHPVLVPGYWSSGAWVNPRQNVSVKNYGSTGDLSSASKHHFYLNPPSSMFWNEFLGPLPWNAGFEYATEYFSNDGSTMIRRELREWTTKRVGVFDYDPRISKEISIIAENGLALGSLTQTEYDNTGSSDPEYFSHLNRKRSKAYNYKALTLSTAQTGSLETIAALFTGSDLAAVSETDYLYDPSYKTRRIIGLPVETRILNPSNPSDVLAKSQVVYDESAYFDNSYITTNWVDPSSNLRGNVTTARTWNKDTDTWIESHTMFDNFGNVRKVWDTSGDPTRFVETEYSSTYNYAYPTRTIAPAPDPTGVHGTTQGSEINRTYDFNTGLLLSVTDDRGQTATTEYDASLRPIRINPPAGGNTSETIYNDTPGNIWVKRRQQIDELNWAESTTYFDNLGRAFKSRTKDLQGDVMSQVLFDSFGRVEKTSNPYRVDSGGNPTETVYWSKARYDERSRVVETYAPAPTGQTGNSLGTVEFGISDLTSLVGTYVVATDPSGRKSRAISGIYGLMRVDEATGIGGTVDQDLGTLANPNQPTSYTYNIKGELTKITQGSQNRYFLYDSFGRLIRVRQPEQTPNSNLATTGNPDNNAWTAAYSYDVFGNVISMTDAKNTTIANQYDKAGRPILRTYTDGTPQVEFFYDGKGLPSVPQFSKGALTRALSSVSEDRFTEFDNHGRLLASEQITDGRSYPFKYAYNLSGGLVEQQYPSGRIVRNFLDADGGLKSVVTKTATDLYNKIAASNFDYSATGAVKKMKLGNGLWETAQIDHLGQLTQVGLGTTATNNDLFKVDYEYGELQTNGTVDTSKNIGNIAKTTTTIPTTSFVQTFKYDAINRLTEAKETTGAATNWTQNFGYDRFGNRTSFSETIGGVLTPNTALNHPTIDAASNRFTTGQGYTYDFNGNIVQDAEGRSFTFNGDDKQTEVRNTSNNAVIGQYFYDGSGARVKKVVPGGETTIFVYDAGGALAAEYSTETNPQPTTSYLTTDHLGSPRVITDKSGNVIARRDFMPFGEELGAGIGPRTTNLKYSYTGSDNIRKRFTGYEKDDETGLDFAEARMYQNKHGRFTAPDPLLASASGLNPQTFNRYIYTGNNPINYSDPSGLIWCGQAGTGSGLAGIQWQDGDKCTGEGWNPLDLNASYMCNSGPCTIEGTTYAQGTVFRFGQDRNYRAALADPGPVSQHQNVAAASGGLAGQPAAEAAASGAGSGGSPVPTGGTSAGDPLSIGCAEGMICPIPAKGPPVIIDLTPGASAEEVLDFVQTVLDTAGMIPIIGEPADAISGLISAGRGDYIGAAMSVCALNPAGGQACGAGKLARRLANAIDTVNDLRKSNISNAHHVIQDAAVRDIPGYNPRMAPGTHLPGPPYGSTPHGAATAVQKQRGGGTYGAERRIGYKAMRRAGLSKWEARIKIDQADKYFGSLGVTKSTPTRIPGDRR